MFSCLGLSVSLTASHYASIQFFLLFFFLCPFISVESATRACKWPSVCVCVFSLYGMRRLCLTLLRLNQFTHTQRKSWNHRSPREMILFLVLVLFCVCPSMGAASKQTFKKKHADDRLSILWCLESLNHIWKVSHCVFLLLVILLSKNYDVAVYLVIWLNLSNDNKKLLII